MTVNQSQRNPTCPGTFASKVQTSASKVVKDNCFHRPLASFLMQFPHLCSVGFSWESPTRSICPFLHFTYCPPVSFSPLFIFPNLIYVPGSSSTHPHFQQSFWYSMLIHSFNISKPFQSTFLGLVLYFLHLELSLNVANMFLILSLPVFPTIPSEISSQLLVVYFPLSVHVHVSALDNRILFKYTYIL